MSAFPLSLRAEVAALLPDGAFLRVDRTGRALYVTRSGADLTQLCQRGWRCERTESIAFLSPGRMQLDALRSQMPIHGDLFLNASRFDMLPTDEALLPLFTSLLRAHELPPVDSQLHTLEKQLRQSVALALRTHRGGGLEVCTMLFQLLPRTRR